MRAARPGSEREGRPCAGAGDEHLPALLMDIAAIVGPRPSFIALSAHTPGYDGERLAALIREHLLVSGHGEALVTRSRAGATLALGAWARGPHR